ncbi:ANM_HP_G0049830.mRNA.1.CDS.1 [Saccharomyces cerevisiae]|nr:ANM_HP_G0231060.mRNA.1.CDS.1 [Saccharomyces cerevisiae]CAI5218000.1 ANM_HP_G0026850.mRNA.1.CDS.1 [Saccharomyces cerevisiae]CAI5222857.1 ANM_HP_G0049830.mRNA.1.CDS.1 [Saccharomyces cerevisiae]CAI6991653.1 ANM_HP_G0231060.mRNA.1.CDS.1 [Saccharomyces cerevisiae]CAI7023470.1 ANM_HP_G0026850.mRNA.1.CDS.1 [Saccharomyces cerevisiae]
MIVGLTLYFVLFRSIQYLLVFLTPIRQFDTSTSLLLNELCSSPSEINSYWNKYFWNKLLSWDSVFFIKNITSKNGKPQFEHEYAFSQLWTFFVRLFIKSNNDSIYHALRVGVAIENVLFYLSGIVLYFLTKKIFSQNIRQSQFARTIAKKTSLLFFLTSAAGFLTSIYSEPLSFFFAFVGIWSRECSISVPVLGQFDIPWRYWFPYSFISMTCFTLASLNRSNCVLLGIYFIFDLIELTKNRKFVKAICFPLLSGSLMFSALLYQQYYLPYKTFCPQRGEWCKSQLFSSIFITKTSLYSYIQSHYWGVGLLKYWTPKNIPNFLFAVPNIIILIYSSIYFSKIYPSYNLKALVWITRALVVIVCFFAHVQILNRIASFLPLHLWYLADRLVKTSDPKKMENPKGDDKIVKFYIYWLAFWIPLQTILFAAFLPPA